ncbi:hypothetical protein [Hirschia litorea]|uniref:Uncharacterized protein n=1 Tax=Hirschia litorea TaxID=1199156 RepID=A0ABW2II33_9PROT
MSNKPLKPELKALLIAAVMESVCLGGGVIAWLSTDKIIWLAIGVVAGVGFSLPAVITFVRASKGQK